LLRACCVCAFGMLTLVACGAGSEAVKGTRPVSSAPQPNGGAPSGPSSQRHVARPRGTVAGTTSGFWEYLPPHYGNGERYPLLIFWHGSGENGDGSSAALQKVPANGPPRLLKEDRWPEERRFIVLSPQHPGTDCPSSAEVHDFVRFAIANYEVDDTRVYLTGLSCGAIGSWQYLGDHLDEAVAAAVLVCGDGRSAFAKAGCSLGRVPIWALHGELDPTVPPAGSIEPLTQLIACSPPPVDAKLTVYPGVAHDSWTATYDLSAGNDIYAWLLSHSKPRP
jgi:predicted peptidase